MEQKNVKFLLVDDSELVRVTLRKTIGQLGYSLMDEAANGVEALAKMNRSVESKTPYHIVFCDWLMPEMSGLQVIETCQASETLKHIPIVMITAESEKKSVLRALQAGALAYIVKPIEATELKNKIERILASIA